MGMLIRRQPEPLLTPLTIKALWWLCERAHRSAMAGPPAAQVTTAPIICAADEAPPLLHAGVTYQRLRHCDLTFKMLPKLLHDLNALYLAVLK